MIMDSLFWKDKPVLVTGANGFIGSWLSEYLVNSGAQVSTLIKKDDPVGLDSISSISKKVKIVYGDIRDNKLMDKIVKDQDVVMHLAAVTQVLFSIKNPVETVEVDVNGTLNIIEAMRRKNDSAFLVFTSTDKVYGEPQYVPIDEKHSLSAKSPYDASKLAADRLVYSYQTTYGLKSAISRCSNVIGGRDANILRVLPSAIYLLMKNKKPVIRSGGANIRDYMFVDDAVRAISLLAEKQALSNGLAFNFGTGKPTTVLQVVREAIRAYYKTDKFEPVILNQNISGEIDKQYLSSTLAYDKLGWKPTIELKEAVGRTVAWYQNNSNWFNVMDKTSTFYGLDLGKLYG